MKIASVFPQILFAVISIALPALSAELMPPSQQTELVRKYCAVCHTDAVKTGGLSLEHYDAAVADPALAAMLLSKLRGGAIGAAGLKHPDQATQDAWFAVTGMQAREAKSWNLVRSVGRVVAASIVREVLPREPGGGTPQYRLTISCDTASGEGEVLLTWSPQPQMDWEFAVAADWGDRVPYQVGRPAVASVVLKTVLPQKTLTVRELFSGETVVFPVGDLGQAARREIGVCFGI